jgi:hypothetical protein
MKLESAASHSPSHQQLAELLFLNIVDLRTGREYLMVSDKGVGCGMLCVGDNAFNPSCAKRTPFWISATPRADANRIHEAWNHRKRLVMTV